MSTDEVQVLNQKVDKILGYLHNDEGTGKKGLVAAFEEHKKQMDDFMSSYATEQSVKKAKMGVWGAVGGAILTFLVFVGKTVGAWFFEHFHK